LIIFECGYMLVGLNCINKQLTRVKISEWGGCVWGEYPHSIIQTMSSTNISLSRSSVYPYVKVDK
jgi:hypothetical protein